jgi:hypothetical protein
MGAEAGGMNWGPDHPHWKYGHIDSHLAELEAAATLTELSRLDFKTALDVGAGSCHWTDRILPGAARCDLHPDVGVARANAVALPYEDGAFDLVHCRRVLSNIEWDTDVHRARDELVRVARRYVVVVDVFEEPYLRVQRLRHKHGLPELQRNSGKNPLPLQLFAQPSRPIAASYYLWTRALWPILNRIDMPWDHPDRSHYPQQDPETEDRYGVHRLLVIPIS